MERSEELQDLVRASFEAYSKGDTSFIDRHTSSHDGVRLIGSDPNEWFEGASGRSLETKDTSRRRNGMLHGEVDAFVEGNVDWVSSRPVWTLERVMNSIGNGLGMRETAMTRDPS